jgi:hypothetical protein
MLNPTLLTATTVMLLLPNPKRLMLGYLLGDRGALDRLRDCAGVDAERHRTGQGLGHT